MADSVDLGRLTTFQHHVDDMRNLIMCKICLKPLYEPYILACGHTYCYGCLRSWFSGLDNRKRKKNCPDCRAEVMLTPSPNYILRDLVHMFINRTELLPEDETVDEHMAGKLAEAELLATDRDGRGLFQGVFPMSLQNALVAFGPLHDVADGVMRCPECYWELEDGQCEQCGYEANSYDRPEFSDPDPDDLDEQSITSDASSSVRGIYHSGRGIPHHFYGAGSTADDTDQSLSTRIYSDVDYDSDPGNRFAPVPEDDDMDGFIDDEPDEVDEDDMGGPGYRQIPRPRGRQYRILEDSEESDEELEERPYRRWHAGGRVGTSDASDNEEVNTSDEDDQNEDQQTNYDESDEENTSVKPMSGPTMPARRSAPIIYDEDDYEDDDENRSVTPIARPTMPVRRSAPVIHDEDDDEDDEDDDEIDNIVNDEDDFSDADSHTVGPSQSEGGETDGSDSDDSDANAIPPQLSAYRRQRLETHRKRRRAPTAWRALVRGNRDVSDDRRERQPTSTRM